jgi:putative endonuclease
MRERTFFFYILANRPDGVLYTGVTSDLKRRVSQHKSGEGGGFTKRYNVDCLVYFEVFSEPLTAITREKQIKGGPRWKKVELIERSNPQWKDLYDEV